MNPQNFSPISQELALAAGKVLITISGKKVSAYEKLQLFRQYLQNNGEAGRATAEAFKAQFEEYDQIYERAKRIGYEFGKLDKESQAGLLQAMTKDVSPSLDTNQKSEAALPPIARSIGQAIKELLVKKRSANKTPRYIRSLEQYLHQFAKGRENIPIAEMTTECIEEWLNRYPCASTRQTWLNRLSALFSFANRIGYIAINPTVRIERVMLTGNHQ